MGILHNLLDALGLVETIEETPQKTNEPVNQGKNDSRIVNMTQPATKVNNAAPKSNVVALQPPREKAGNNVKKNDDAVNAKMVLKEPTRFEEAQDIADDLLAGKAVIINIESCDPEIAAKLVDFIGGVIYAIGGDIQKITDDTLVSAPANIDIAKDIANAAARGENVGTEVFAWLNKYNQRSDF